MATVDIPSLGAAAAISGTDLIPVTQGTTTAKKALVSAIQTFLTPTGTGFPHITSGAQDAAARAVDVSSADVTGTLAAARFPALTGDVTNTAGAVATTIANNAVTNAKAAQMAAHTHKGNNTGSTANALDLTAAQLLADITPLTTKGDLYTHSTVDIRLAVGTDGQVLTADSTQATGVKWAAGGGSGTVTNTGTLTANRLIVGNGSADVTALGSLGSTTTVLHGNASGAPTFGAVNLAADVTGVIPALINAQTGTSYTVVAGDQGKLVTLSNAAAVAVTQPQATGSFTTGWSATLLNLGAGLVTITPTTSTINGAATVVLATGQWLTVVSDGTNYQATIGGRVANTLRSATTLVDVAAATAPTNGQVLTATGGTAATWQTPAASGAISGFILGMNPTWTSTTVLGASSGTVYIESLAATISGAPADITPSSPSASTWYHIYVFSSSGTPTLEASTTAPVAFATPAGNARSKSGDTSRRYLYSAKTDGSSNFYRFSCFDGLVFRWLAAAINASPFRVLNNGTSTTAAVIDCSVVIPTTARLGLFYVDNTSAAGALFVASNEYTVTSSLFEVGLGGTASSGNPFSGAISVDSAQKLNYLILTGSTSNNIDCLGFHLLR